MITCKEDLVNTYIENDNGVLRDVYVSLMKLHSVHSCGEKDFGYILDKPCFGCYQWDHTGGLQAEWNQQCPLEGCKQLTLTDLLPTSYENTKVYSLDEDVIRKYAELCGVELNHRHTDDEEVGICKVNNQGFVDTFIVGSVVDIEVKYTVTTITPEQILAAWDLRFGEEKTRTESEYQAVVKERDELFKICTRHDEEIESPKLPRTKVEFVKCEFEHAWQAVKMIEGGETLFRDSGGNDVITIREAVTRFITYGEFYRRTEVEIDWRDEVEAYLNSNRQMTQGETRYINLNIGESSFALGESELLEMCRVALRATGELTPKP